MISAMESNVRLFIRLLIRSRSSCEVFPLALVRHTKKLRDCGFGSGKLPADTRDSHSFYVGGSAHVVSIEATLTHSYSAPNARATSRSGVRQGTTQCQIPHAMRCDSLAGLDK